MQARILDADGAELTDLEVDWTVAPTSAAQNGEQPDVFVLAEEGEVEITGCIDEGMLCDNVRLLVDASSPNLEVETPTPGAELGGDDTTAIEVRGSVADTREVRVFVNGQQADLDDMGQFAGLVASALWRESYRGRRFRRREQ